MPKHQTDKTYQRLLRIKGRAMAPYSHYEVGALVDTDKGLFEGFNVESAVFPLAMCAERVALFNALVHGAKKIKSLALITDSATSHGTPCGSCRQLLLEHMAPHSKIMVYTVDGKSRTYTMAELLPHAFTNRELQAGGA